MYKHIAESIKESDDKQFISLEEKTKFRNYNNEFRRKDDSYSKSETDNKIKDISDITYDNVEGNFISINDTLESNITNIEILGNTYQDPNNLSHIISSGELQSDGKYRMNIVSCGKNLYNGVETSINSTGFNFSVPDKLTEGDYYFGFKTSTEYNINSVYLKSSNPLYNRVIGTITKQSNGRAYGRITLTSEDIQIINTSISSLRMTVYRGDGDCDTPSELMISTVDKNEYEPYKATKSTILTNEPHEGIEKYKDIIYYDKELGVWCKDKYIIETVLKVNMINMSNWNESETTVGCLCNYTNDILSVPSTEKSVICNKLPSETYTNLYYLTDREGISVYRDNGYGFVLRVNKTRLNGRTMVQFIEEEELKVKYVTATPEKIILPLSTQIALNSFFGTTHILNESGYADVTIKSSIPKSLGASVNSLQDETEIIDDRVEIIEGMKDSQNITYATEKSYVNCLNTINGMVDKLKLSGRTLINLCENPGKKTLTDASWGYDVNLIRTINVGEEVTLSVNVLENTASKRGLCLRLIDVNGENKYPGTISKANKLGIVTFKFKVETDLKIIQLYLHSDDRDGVQKITLENPSIIVGDHTQNPPSYFEGITNVGNDSQIEVLSSNGNFANMDYIRDKDNYYSITGGGGNYKQIPIYVGCRNTTVYLHSKFKKPILSSEINSLLINNIKGTTSNYTYIRDTGTIKAITDSNGYVYIAYLSDFNEIFNNRVDTFTITTNDTYEIKSHKAHKKPIFYKNDLGEWIPLTELREYDYIEKHSDGKYYLHIKSGEVIFNGNEPWINGLTNTDDILNFVYDIPGGAMGLHVICDKFISQYYGLTAPLNIESILSGTGLSAIKGRVNIRIHNSELETPDVNGFKKWLQSNPVTVVYQLAEEKIYEVNNLDLESYEGETAIICESGAINSIMEFEITRHINAAFKVLEDRARFLEEKMYNMFRDVLYGDMQSLAYKLYPEDFINKYKPELLI